MPADISNQTRYKCDLVLAGTSQPDRRRTQTY
jgi:hypothetical protein